MEEDADKIEKTVMTERSTKEIAEYNRQITSEKNKILKIFKDCNADVKKIASPLIDNASYMKVELAHLKK